MRGTHVFISYRRDSGGGHAGRLFDAIAQHVGREQVFMDAVGIAPGANFVQSLKAALQQCGAMVVVVTPGWSTLTDADNLRLLQADDWVRIEIETALASGIRVVPALVAGARMPAAGNLPASLKAFAECQAVDLRDASWDDDCRRLLTALGLQTTWRMWAAISAVVALPSVLIVAGVIWWSGDTPRVAGQASGATASEDRYAKLTSLTPSASQETALVDRMPASNFNVLLLRRFLAQARQRSVPTAQLEAELIVFAKAYGAVQRANVYDQTSITRLDKPVQPPCNETAERLRDADFPAAIAAFDAGASSALSQRRADGAQRTYAAWCLWLRGQTQRLDGDIAGGAASYERALSLLPQAGPSGRYLALGLLPDAARVAAQDGQPAVAAQRLEQAVAASDGFSTSTRTDLMLKLATLHDSQGQPALALPWRERAQQLFDAAHDPGDQRARSNATSLAQTYDAAGRPADAKVLRERYGLAGPR